MYVCIYVCIYVYKSSLYKIISFKLEITTTTIIITATPPSIMNFKHARPIKCLMKGYKEFGSVYRAFCDIFTSQEYLKKSTFPNESEKWTKEDLERMHINIYSINMIFDIRYEADDERGGMICYLVAQQIINNKPIYFRLRAFDSFENDYCTPEGDIVFGKYSKEFFENFSNAAFKNRAILFLEEEEEKEEKSILRSNTDFRIQKVNKLDKRIKTMSNHFKTREDISKTFKEIVDSINKDNMYVNKMTPAKERAHWSEKELLAMNIDIDAIDVFFEGYCEKSFERPGYDYYLAARQIVNRIPIYFEMTAFYPGPDYPYDEGNILFSKFPEIFINDFASKSFKKRARVFLKDYLKIQIKDEEGEGESGKRKREKEVEEEEEEEEEVKENGKEKKIKRKRCV